MITVIFRRVSRNLTWSTPGGSRTISAFSEVRNELNGERPDPSRLPDTETAVSMLRTTGPIVMPRPFPLGTWQIYAIEPSSNKWMSPRKILTRAHQPVPIYKTDARGHYAGPAGGMFDDWAYWIHFCNGSHHTDGCVGVERLNEFNEFADMVDRALKSNIPIYIKAVDE